MSVVNALVGAGLSDPQIIDVFDTYPIGEKYHEKGVTKDEWLLKHIEKWDIEILTLHTDTIINGYLRRVIQILMNLIKIH